MKLLKIDWVVKSLLVVGVSSTFAWSTVSLEKLPITTRDSVFDRVVVVDQRTEVVSKKVKPDRVGFEHTDGGSNSDIYVRSRKPVVQELATALTRQKGRFKTADWCLDTGKATDHGLTNSKFKRSLVVKIRGLELEKVWASKLTYNFWFGSIDSTGVLRDSNIVAGVRYVKYGTYDDGVSDVIGSVLSIGVANLESKNKSLDGANLLKPKRFNDSLSVPFDSTMNIAQSSKEKNNGMSALQGITIVLLLVSIGLKLVILSR